MLGNATNVVTAYLDLLERGQQDDLQNYGHCIFQLHRALPNVQTLILGYGKVLSLLLILLS